MQGSSRQVRPRRAAVGVVVLEMPRKGDRMHSHHQRDQRPPATDRDPDRARQAAVRVGGWAIERQLGRRRRRRRRAVELTVLGRRLPPSTPAVVRVRHSARQVARACHSQPGTRAGSAGMLLPNGTLHRPGRSRPTASSSSRARAHFVFLRRLISHILATTRRSTLLSSSRSTMRPVSSASICHQRIRSDAPFVSSPSERLASSSSSLAPARRR